VKLDRRELFQLAGPVVVGAALGFFDLPRQTSEQTPEADPFAQIDTANIELINSQIENKNRDEFVLESPRLAALGRLNLQPFTPDVGFGVLTSTNGAPYALVYNHNMACVSEPLNKAGLLEETEIYDGPRKGTVLDPGVSEIHITPVDASLRLDSATVEPFLDEYEVEINGVETTLPVLTIKSFELEGEAYDCPTITERVGGILGDAIDRVQEGLSNFEFGETLESAGAAVGQALGNIAQGTARGIREGLND